MRTLSTSDYAALTPPMKTIPPEQTASLVRRGLIWMDSPTSFDLTQYGALAVRVYQAYCAVEVK